MLHFFLKTITTDNSRNGAIGFFLCGTLSFVRELKTRNVHISVKDFFFWGGGGLAYVFKFIQKKSHERAMTLASANGKNILAESELLWRNSNGIFFV